MRIKKTNKKNNNNNNNNIKLVHMKSTKYHYRIMMIKDLF